LLKDLEISIKNNARADIESASHGGHMRLAVFVILTAFLSACGSELKSDDATVASTSNEGSAQVSTMLSPLAQDDLLRVTKAGMSAATGADISTMKARATEENTVRISAVRDDGKAFAYDLMVEGNAIKTRMIDEAGPGTGPGAWSGRGSTVSYVLTPKSVTINTTFFDGSSDTEEFKI
jgi:hypothetical protein